MNPAPLSQQLSNEEVYSRFNARTMEIGRIDRRAVPEQFNINEAGEIVELTLQEKVDAGIVQLRPDQKVEGKHIVEKPLSEQVADGTITLESHQKLMGEEIVEKTTREKFQDGVIGLGDVKEERLEHFSNTSFQLLNSIVPAYKMQNAVLGVYEDDRLPTYRATVQAYRAEFKRLEGLVQQARTLEEVEGITENFPRCLVTPA